MRSGVTMRQSLVSVANELIVLLQLVVSFYTHLTTETLANLKDLLSSDSSSFMRILRKACVQSSNFNLNVEVAAHMYMTTVRLVTSI